jgi:hypothetical protein
MRARCMSDHCAAIRDVMRIDVDVTRRLMRPQFHASALLRVRLVCTVRCSLLTRSFVSAPDHIISRLAMRVLLVCTVVLCAALACVQFTDARVHDSKPIHRHHSVKHPVHVDLAGVLSSLQRPSVRADADQIISALVDGAFKGLTYDRLANFTDTIGPRVCGSDTLEGAVQFMIDRLTEDGLENVHAEQGQQRSRAEQQRSRRYVECR